MIYRGAKNSEYDMAAYHIICYYIFFFFLKKYGNLSNYKERSFCSFMQS